MKTPHPRGHAAAPRGIKFPISISHRIGTLSDLRAEREAPDVTNEILASYVFSQDDGTVVMVGFADQQYQTKDYVLLQRTLNPSVDDMTRKWDDVHITVNDESRSAYGGVEALELWSDHALIVLAPSTATQVQSGTLLRVNLTTCAFRKI